MREAFDMINITLEQAKTALEIISSDIEMSEFGTPDYKDADSLKYYLDRAVLFERLASAINSEIGGL